MGAVYYSAIGDSWPLIISMIFIGLVFFLFRRSGGSIRRRPELVQNLVNEVRLNQALVKTFGVREKLKKFEVTYWRLNRGNLDFLGDKLVNKLSKVFTMMEEFNQQIKVAQKVKSTTYLSIDVSKLSEPLSATRKGLEDWLEEHTGHRELPPKYPTLMGSLFGEH